jgi:diadenosine tetraphosphate (Ap4A) HIT family hydrolase
MMGRPRGLEPPTPGTTNQCSNQLSYDRHVIKGAFPWPRAPLKGGLARRQGNEAAAVKREGYPVNSTIEKFGYPATLLKELDHWLVLLRPAQVTLGSLVLAAKSEATGYGDLPRAAFAEQADAVALVERALAAFTQYERINYLMLMMVDPHVHFHVIPRYSQARIWDDVEFPDAGWPGPPQLASAVSLSAARIDRLRDQLSVNFC